MTFSLGWLQTGPALPHRLSAHLIPQRLLSCRLPYRQQHLRFTCTQQQLFFCCCNRKKKKKLVFLKAVWSGGCVSFCCDVFVLVGCFFFLPQLFSTTFMLPSFRICFYSAHKTLHFDMYFFFDILTLGVLAWFLLSPLPGKQQGCSHAQCCANQAVVRLISAQCVK